MPWEVIDFCPKCYSPIYEKNPCWSVNPAPTHFSCLCYPDVKVPEEPKGRLTEEDFIQLFHDEKYWS